MIAPRAVSPVLRLLGCEPEPAESREDVPLSVLAERRLLAGQTAELGGSLGARRRRVAHPSRAQPGKTPIVIVSVAHLDDEERALVLGVLLEEILSWVRTLPGSQRLRALLVFDEVCCVCFGREPDQPRAASKCWPSAGRVLAERRPMSWRGGRGGGAGAGRPLGGYEASAPNQVN